MLLGAIGSVDPPRTGVGESIAKCRRAGVRVIMITGDQRLTACAIGKDIGLLDMDLTGEELEAKSCVCSQLHVDDDPTGEHLPDDVIDEMTSR